MSVPRREDSLFFPVNFSEAGGKQHKPAVYAGFGVRAEDLFSFFPVFAAAEASGVSAGLFS